MRRDSIVVVACFAAVAVAAAMLTGTASAAGPEFGRCVFKAGGKYANSGCDKIEAGKNKFEWEPGPGPNNKFSIGSSEGVFGKSVGGLRFQCRGVTGHGEIANAKEVANVVMTFSGCTDDGSCSTDGTEGTVVTKSLSGVLGVETQGTEAFKNRLALELHGEGPEEIVAEPFCGIPVVIRGAVLHKITTNKMSSTYTEKFIAKNSVDQIPEHFAGGIPGERILEQSFAGGPLEQWGLEAKLETHFEEKIEAYTGAPSPTAPEFGRCVGLAGGKFTGSTCTTELAGVEKFEWEPGPGPKKHFTNELKPGAVATLEAEGAQVTCTGETGHGEVASSKEVSGVVFALTGCESAAGTCRNAGAAKGEIVTNVLSGQIALNSGKIPEELDGPGGVIAEFGCGPVSGEAVVVLHGSAVHNIAANTMRLKTSETYNQKRGEEFWSMTLLQTFEEKIEANTFV